MRFLRTKHLVISTLGAAAISAFVVMPGDGLAQQMGDKATMVVKTSIGNVLADSKGMTLYTFTKDVTGQSNCYGKCATAWPPLMAATGAKSSGDFSIIKRKGGSMQWALKGQPLYLWFKDKKKGDTTGDGVRGVWVAVRQ